MRTAAHLLGATLAAPPAPAGPYPLTWEAPPQCPDQAQARQRIDGYLERIAAQATPVAVEIRVVPIRRGRLRLDATIEVTDGLGHRRLEGNACSELLDAASLVVALAVDPEAVARYDALAASRTYDGPVGVGAGPEPPPPSPPPRKPPPSDPPPAVEPPPPVAVPGRLHASLAAEVGGAFVVIPGGTVTLGLAAGLGGKWWSVTATGRGFFPRTTDVVDGAQQIDATFSGFTIGARGCGIPGIGRFRFPLCVEGSAGLIRGEAGGDVFPQRSTSPWAHLRAGPGLLVGVSHRVSVGVGVDAVVQVARPRFEVIGVGQVCCDVAGVLPWAGVEIRVP